MHKLPAFSWDMNMGDFLITHFWFFIKLCFCCFLNLNRTKLKQTEVDCEYLKRCCETLTEENRRLQKELQELRALKTSQPFYMQLPATTLTMCPSCERVATSSATTNDNKKNPVATVAATVTIPLTTTTSNKNSTPLSLANKPRLYPFAQAQAHQAASWLMANV